jgi:sugar/nucleoside kinase (ribokinase family)
VDGVEGLRAEAVDGTAAGDALCTPLVVSLLQGRERGEAREEVLAR